MRTVQYLYKYILYTRYRLSVVHKIPHLAFLDATPITHEERKESYHSGHVALTHSIVTKIHHDVFRPISRSEDDVDDGHSDVKKTKTFFGKLRYGYSGKYSEGNRFITDNDL